MFCGKRDVCKREEQVLGRAPCCCWALLGSSGNSRFSLMVRLAYDCIVNYTRHTRRLCETAADKVECLEKVCRVKKF